MRNDVWILSADTHKARLYRAATPYSEEIVEIKTFLQPEAALHERDLVRDDKGRTNQRVGEHRHPKEPPSTQKEKSAASFAKHIADYLDAEHKKGEFYKLGLIAAPAMLGELRAQMSPTLAKDLSFEVDKNVTQLNPEEFRKHLPEKLAPARL